MRKGAIAILSSAVAVFILLAPVVYRSEYERCESDAMVDSLSPSPNYPKGCMHVTVSQSVSYQFVGFGGVLFYPVGYTIDNCACFGVRVP